MSNDTEAMVGSEMLLDCAVTGNPPAEVLWLTPRYVFQAVLRIRDAGSCSFLIPGSGMGKKKSKSGSGMNIPDHISESLETIVFFWVKNAYIL
jgi:hypothetical protein